MAKLSRSIDVPLPPEEAWKYASDLSRYKEWLTIHRVWRSKVPDVLEKGTVIESYVEVKGMPNRIRWTIVHYKPPEAMTPKGDGSVVSFNVHLGGPALFGPIGMIVAAALRTDIRESLQNFVTVFAAPDPRMNGDRGVRR